MKKIVIFGAGGHAHVVADIVKAEGNIVVAFLDDDLTKPDCSGPISDYLCYSDCEYVIGIGNADIRERMSCLPIRWHTAIHPSATVSPSAIIGFGTVIMPGAVVNSNAIIGNHCIINTSAVVEHDNQIRDYAHVSVGVNLGGSVKIGRKTWIGIGSTVLNNIEIGDNIMIGAGSVVVKDIRESGIYYGAPARKKEK